MNEISDSQKQKNNSKACALNSGHTRTTTCPISRTKIPPKTCKITHIETSINSLVNKWRTNSGATLSHAARMIVSDIAYARYKIDEENSQILCPVDDEKLDPYVTKAISKYIEVAAEITQNSSEELIKEISKTTKETINAELNNVYNTIRKSSEDTKTEINKKCSFFASTIAGIFASTVSFILLFALGLVITLGLDFSWGDLYNKMINKASASIATNPHTEK